MASEKVRAAVKKARESAAIAAHVAARALELKAREQEVAK